ncbi:MAG: hypothetical protein P4L56_06305 [Candidatus Sulfopaludibacter sp.]|nr:hypothetical protein [Candidatus Sulfopaludibacter sp.]
MPPGGKRVATTLSIYGIGLLLLATLVTGAIELVQRPRTKLTRVPIGSHDEVYYYHAATPEEARALGAALQKTGFLNDRGTTVLLSKGTGGTLVSFALNDGAWNHPDTVYSFEEIGRRIATSIGGFPIKVRLIDSHRLLHKELTVGKHMVGSRDAVYYLGSATEAEASALAQALRAAGFLRDQGDAVVLSRNDAMAISFIVNDGVWDRPDAVAGLEHLVRKVAPAVGGLPIQLRLVDGAMEPRKSLTVQ